ncbi:SNF2 family N-terminal domain-containing protein [Melanogaster broomeanus]|nr:SNF2 family N-terminal domain-containing protein [Melanogaster broomeanus]
MVDLRYNTSIEDKSQHYADDRSAKKWGWLDEEERLLALVETHRKDVTLPQDIDMGKFYITRYHGRLLALSWRAKNERWLLLLPDIPWPDSISLDDLEQHDLQPSGIAQRIHNSLREGTYDPQYEFPFRLRAHFTLSLTIPTIYKPFNNSLTQRRTNELEGLQRRLVCFLSKTPLNGPVHTNVTNGHLVGDATIPFFLGIMRPAPPLPEDVTYESLQPDGLVSTLLPFQRRTVAWMLEREGKRITSEGIVVPLDNSTVPDPDPASTWSEILPVFWERIKMGGQDLFFNRLTTAVSPTLPKPHTALGGILAEEPGLGKTMECLSLLLLNPAPERSPMNKRWDPEAQLYVKEIKTTLIVTPPALATQWADELAAHAPDLKVFVYDGWAKVKVPISEADVEVERQKRRSAASQKVPLKPKTNGKQNGKGKSKLLIDGDIIMDDNESAPTVPTSIASDADSDPNPILDWPAYINQFDVCITTYNVLRVDMTVARAPPKRPRRQDVEYKNLNRPRSPLVMCEWYRVIMDEVQMMGTGKSEEMVSLIPRLSSFAVSGTPARAEISDLIRVLRFLRVHDLVAPARIWNRLLKHDFKDMFAAFFERYSVSLGGSSDMYVSFQAEFKYSLGCLYGFCRCTTKHWKAALIELGLDARGVAGYEGWTVDASVLRNILRRLRGICTHPQVGQLQRQGDKLNKTGALKSIGEVLEAMRDQNWRNLMDDRKAKTQALIRLAQLQQHQADDRDRYQRALEHLLTAETEINELIEEIKAAIAQHHVRGEALKKETQALRDLRKMNVPSDTATEKNNGKGKEKYKDPVSPLTDLDADADEEDDIEDRDLPKTLAGEEHRVKRRTLQARLRECMMTCIHVLGASYSDKEDAAYADAESLRKDLLKSTEESAHKGMQRLSGVYGRGLQIALPFLRGGGVRSTHLFEEANEMIEDTLNEQSALLWGEQADGEEYARTLHTQSEAEVYLQAYATLLADRREVVVAERTLLAAHDAREKKARRTKAALAAAATAAAHAQDELEVPEDVDVQPEHEVLYKNLMEERKELFMQSSGRALKSVMVELNGVAALLPRDTDPEKIIAKDGVASLRALIASQLGIMDKLDADLAELRRVFNDRIVYFRHLQEISDTVAEVAWEGRVDNAMDETRNDRADLGDKINTGRARQRYLDHLAKNKEGTMADDDDELVYHAMGCMKAYFARKLSRTCPVCRVPIDENQLQRFTIHGDQPPPPKPVLSNGEPVPVSQREIQYNMIDPAIFSNIQTMESEGSYGSKIQTLVRHLLHIQLVDPGAKSIVFSAWADSLTIIEHALARNDIPYFRLDQNRGRKNDGGAKQFRNNPDLQVLLLHGERDNAGLNVTCASRVFLVESVVNHSFEMQGISWLPHMTDRRLRRTIAIALFCYYAEDTVEKNILDLAARQVYHCTRRITQLDLLIVTSFATDAAKNLVDSPKKTGQKGQPIQKGDFIFKVNDMLAILFPHMFEEIQFLLPPDTDQELLSNRAVNSATRSQRMHVNAEAGPSRLAAA